MITLNEREVFFLSWEELPKRKRHYLMMLLPFLEDPYAQLLALRIICKEKSTYQLINSAPNSSELIVELWEKGFQWITAPPKSYSYPEVKVKGWTFATPDVRFESVTFGQWWAMDSLFTRYMRTQKDSLFDRLLAELYTVKVEGTKEKLEAISFLDYTVRLDAFRVHASVREKVFTHFRWLFPKVKMMSEKADSKPLDFRQIQDSTDLGHSLLFRLAEYPAYQGMKTAQETSMWEAFTYLDQKAFEIEQSKRPTP